MDGGTISNNWVEYKASTGSYSSSWEVLGAGVYFSSGSFVMNGGTITNNRAESDMRNTAGGGVYVASNQTFIMNGGTISNNTNTRDSYAVGGGVAAWSDCTFTMTGGTISSNRAESHTGWFTSEYAWGGGVYVRNTRFTKTGGTISGNTVTANSTGTSRAVGSQVYAELSPA